MENTFLTGLILISPILSVRFLLLSYLGKEALIRAAFFPPTVGIERIAYWINILTTLALSYNDYLLRVRRYI